MGKTFVGMGFGPIQSGLFLLEAHATGNFERFVVAEVVPEVVANVRAAGGNIRINVAHPTGLETREVSGLEIYNPLDAADQSKLIDAIAAAHEIATALPSVDFFHRGTPSPAQLLARGIERKLANRSLPRAVVYAAENHNHAAEKLHDAVLAEVDSDARQHVGDRIQFVNTVIGKMSGVVTDPGQIRRDHLAPLIAGGTQAMLVEQFNRILISQITWKDFERGLHVFQEKPDLLPFEEAKLFGHNTAHALLGYLANRQGLMFIHESDAEMQKFVERAFLDESGLALCRRYAGIDPLFTSKGWAEYVQDLLQRMVNPFLMDRVDRVIRDPRRKLGWDDRFIGAMRLVLEQDAKPRRIAVGAALAIDMLRKQQVGATANSLLDDIWGAAAAGSQTLRSAIIECIEQAQLP